MNFTKNLIFFEDTLFNLRNRIIFVDIDGTLLPDSESVLDARVRESIYLLKKHNEVYLCTNSRNHIRNRKIEDQLDLKIINLQHKKPSKKIISSISPSNKKNFTVIGDKYLTDGLFAKNIGAEFILTKRKISGNETWKIKLFNFIDDFIYNIVRFSLTLTKIWKAKTI